MQSAKCAFCDGAAGAAGAAGAVGIGDSRSLIYNIYTNTQIVCINRPQPLVFPFATVPMPL